MDLLKQKIKSLKINKFFQKYDTFDIKVLKDLENIEDEEEKKMQSKKNFEKISKQISNTKLILLVGHFFKYISGITNTKPVSPRLFLSSYLILTDIESISSSPDNNNEELIQKATILLKEFEILKFVSKRNNNICFFVERFQNILTDFVDTFYKWKEKDMNNLLEALFISYYQIKDMFDTVSNLEEDHSPYRAITQKCYQDQMADIKKSILNLDPKNGIEKLEEYKKNLKKVSISDDIYDIARKAYWDFLEEELKQNPTNFTTTLKLIQDISGSLKELTPTNKELHRKVDEHLDISYFQQMVDNNVFGKDELASIVNFIFTTILEYESPERNEETNEILKSFSDFMKKDDNDYFMALPKMIPELFQKAFDKIDLVNKDLMEVLEKMDKLEKK